MTRTHIAIISAAAFVAGGTQAALVGYWNFDSYTSGPNPAGTPQGGNQGYFTDLSGNDQNAYAAEFASVDYVPFQDAPAGRFGGAFYSENTGNHGALAVVPHNDTINFDQEDFTISFWEKSQFRDVIGNGWAPGRGRSQWFAKAPYIPPEEPNVTKEGYGLNLTQNHFDFMTNTDDNFGQASLGARFTFPSGTTPAYDSGVWAHWAITGTYNAATNDYTIAIYLNGVAVDWDGATGTSFTVANDIIDNEGDLTIGSFWRNNGYATQRFISWNMTNDASNGKGWMDDFAMWDEVLGAADLAALAAGTAQPQDVGSAPPGLILGLASNGSHLEFSWESRAGKVYDLLSATDLSTAPDTWVPWQSEITATPPENTEAFARPGDATIFFALRERDAPPIFSEDFESGNGGFTVATTQGTDWAHGDPDSIGPGGAVTTGNDGSTNCWGTGIGNAGFFANPTDTCLRSAVIDLTGITEAELSFAQAIDLDSGDAVTVNIIDDTTDTVIAANIVTITDGEINTADWENVGPVAIPAAALGQPIRIEWCLSGVGGANADYMGWYIDDVSVTIP
jgi:hypothetical protein